MTSIEPKTDPLALWFESTNLSKIRRHHQAMRPLPIYDPNQLELFDPF